ncbi:molybdenum ABC transporter ATP-binding protein [Zophobihabitans entericus]|uniref:Molybdenum ABC transporter ATP-binding protein n=1 Tax=Zophobihabitans entericus TaxID=1635327 RepID=A0A6G9IBY9_9GAMM|nr:molybdenum ABC transporter ATP-binding protein [Zophobihabitans entericus]QIQ21745.1 molybdenum ABC transporter ATP-binding protein [Zophobihabitans entericus]
MMLIIQAKKRLAHFTLCVNTQLACEGVTAVLGVSGSGKTTLINLINGLTKPDQGLIQWNNTILFDTENSIFIPPERRHIGTVFQEALLFPHYKVINNLTYGMAPHMQRRFDEIIDVLNIRNLLNRYPAMLSGGEKQRVSIGRALLSGPRFLLMDEPLSALDMPRKKELLTYIQKLVQEINIPIIYVTHNMNEARQIASHVLVMNQGEIINSGPTAQVLESDYFKDWL